MSEHMNEHYMLNHYETRRKKLMAEAQQARLKAEVLAAARQQKQRHHQPIRLPNVGQLFRALFQARPVQPPLPDCPELETLPS